MSRCLQSGALLMILLLFCCGQLLAQENGNDSLRRRIDSLEAKVSRIERRIIRPEPQNRTQTRSNLESGRYGGFVVADVFNTKLTIGGYVQGDFIYDVKQPGNTQAFTPSSIPVNNLNKGFVAFSARQTRLTISSQSETKLGTLKTILELDLFNPDGSNNPRLRHAWGELGKWGAGQYWSAFMDIDVFPNIIDYEGPNAMVFVRQMQLRFTQPLSKKTTLAFTVENPGSDVKFPADSGLSSRALFVDIIGQLRCNITGGTHIQLAGLFHPITYDNYLGHEHTNIGWGANLTGVIEVNAKIKDNFSYQVTYGQGISRYFNDLGGQGYDAATKSRTMLENIPVFAVMGFYDHWWSDKLSTTVGYGYLTLDQKDYQPVQDFKSTQYGVANILYYPSAFVKVGLEYLYGKHITIDRKYGDNSRLQFSMMYKF
ncbi:DcaP family trimeric outer membrane transporter [Chitinophaga vietnamensis]|uniref:DcaP family trimeric outer membrane transporter n=1 Tax=Chitinophaga vietnamensis TaxID=2593957 RepID=UPI00117860A9|nr:DcaP family trimeric outer membrane transporter [Chitinophaga vietnamensis]